MPTATNALIYYEAGQSPVTMVELDDSGDHTIYNSADALWSNRSDYEPDVKPNGLATGGKVTPDTVNNQVDVAALTCYLAGILVDDVVAAPGETIARSTSDTNTYRINSITVTAGGVIAVVSGVDEGTSFSETRNEAGGPPWIDTGAIEIAQVRTDDDTAAAIKTTEIFQVPGTHQERYDFPTWEVNRVRVENQVIGLAGITFITALPLIHAGPLPKEVWAEYYEPLFAEVPKSVDFVPAETTHSVSSTEIYSGTVGATSKSLGQGSFTAHLADGISDNLLALKDEVLWFKFKQDRLKNPYVLTQGTLGIARTFPAGASIVAACTISAEEAAVDVVT